MCMLALLESQRAGCGMAVVLHARWQDMRVQIEIMCETDRLSALCRAALESIAASIASCAEQGSYCYSMPAD